MPRSATENAVCHNDLGLCRAGHVGGGGKFKEKKKVRVICVGFRPAVETSALSFLSGGES